MIFKRRYFVSSLLLLFFSLFLKMAHAVPREAIDNRPIVTVTSPKISKVKQSLHMLGTLLSNQSINIVSQVNGRVTALHLKDGTFVKKGTILVELDKREQAALVAKDQFSLDNAQRQLIHLKTLYKRKAISRDALDLQQTQVDTLSATRNSDRVKLSYYTLKAPFDGVLGFHNISVGALINSGDIITTLDDIGKMKLDVDLPQNVLSSVFVGTALIAKTNIWPRSIFAGHITNINPRINETNLTFQARALLDNISGQLKPGMLMKVTIMRSPKKVFTVPARSVLFQGTMRYVYLVNSQHIAEKKIITVGQTNGDAIEVIKGLTQSDSIVDEGVIKVSDQQKIIIKSSMKPITGI